MAVYVLTVNGVPIPALRIGFDIREVANGRNRLSASIYSATGAIPIALFDSVSLTEDGVVIFGGYVDAPSEAGVGGHPITPTITKVSAADWNQLAERRAINLTFPAGTLKSQLLTLLTVFGDVTLDPTQPDGPAMPEWAAIYWRADDILNQLTTLSGGYLWNISYTKVLAMRLASSSLAPVHVTDANRVAIGDITVTPSAENYANQVQLLYGGDGVGATDDHHTGDGTTTVFPVRNQHVSNAGVVSNNGVNETLGAGATWTLTGGGWTLTRTTGAPAVGAAIVFSYNALFPTLVGASAPGGIPTPPGLWEVILRAPDVKHYAVALPMAQQEVAVRSKRPRTIVYRSGERGLHPGQSQTITKTPRHLAGVATVISEVTIQNGTRIVTAVEGTQFPGTWRDMIKGWNDTGGGASSFVSGGGGGGGGGGSIGPGTPGTIAIWTGVNAIGNSILSQSGAVVTVAGGLVATTLSGNGAGLTNLNASALTTGTVAAARLPQFVGGDVVTGAAGSVNLQLVAGAVGASEIAAGAITNTHIAAGAAIDWSKINKSGAVLGDFGGNITWAQLPTFTGTWTADPIINGQLTIGQNIVPYYAYTSDLGHLTKKIRQIHAAELWVETLVAQDTLATIGGRVVVAPTTLLVLDWAAGAADFTVKHNNLAVNDFVYMERGGQSEWMQVTAGPTAFGGWFSYQASRGLYGTTTRNWIAGDALLNTGQTGAGFIDLYSVRSLQSPSQIGPTIVGTVRYGPLVSDMAPRWVVGNLRGQYDYSGSVNLYGAAFGDPSGAWIKIDPTNGVRIGHNTITMAGINAAGNATFSGTIKVGPTSSAQYVTLSAVDTVTGLIGKAIKSDAGLFATTDIYGTTGLVFPAGVGVYSYGFIGRKLVLGFTTRGVGNAPYAELGGDCQYSATTNPLLVNGPYDSGTGQPLITAGYALDVRGNASISGSFRWGGGTVIGSSANIAILDVSNTFTHSNPIFLNQTTTASSYLRFTSPGGTSYFGGDDSAGTTFGFGAYGLGLYAGPAAGVTISATHVSGPIRFCTGGTSEKHRIDSNGDLRPNADNARSVGLATHRYTLIRGVTITPGDLVFENGYAFTESYKVGIAEPGIALVNPDGDVIAFFGASSRVDRLRYVRTTAADRAGMDAQPGDRIIGYDGDRAIRGTAAAIPAPDPATGRTCQEWGTH